MAEVVGVSAAVAMGSGMGAAEAVGVVEVGVVEEGVDLWNRQHPCHIRLDRLMLSQLGSSSSLCDKPALKEEQVPRSTLASRHRGNGRCA